MPQAEKQERVYSVLSERSGVKVKSYLVIAHNKRLFYL